MKLLQACSLQNQKDKKAKPEKTFIQAISEDLSVTKEPQDSTSPHPTL